MQNPRRLITFFVLYSAFLLLYWHFFGSRNAAPPVPVATIEQKALGLEAQAHDEKQPLSQRTEKYREAISQWQQIYHREGSSSPAIHRPGTGATPGPRSGNVANVTRS